MGRHGAPWVPDGAEDVSLVLTRYFGSTEKVVKMSKERLEFDPRYAINNEMDMASFFVVSAGKRSQEAVFA